MKRLSSNALERDEKRAAKRAKTMGVDAGVTPSMDLPLELVTHVLVPYLGRVGRSWAIRALLRLIQVCKSVAGSGWERHVTRLGGEHTGHCLRDHVLHRFAPYLQELSYHAPCHHAGIGSWITNAGLEACTQIHTLALHGNQCYSGVGLTRLPPHLINLTLNTRARDGYVIWDDAIRNTPSIRHLAVAFSIHPDYPTYYADKEAMYRAMDPTRQVDVVCLSQRDKVVALDADTVEEEEEEDDEDEKDTDS